tara:strand:- start:568 stop:831 length:264 start_codon:yes stop_codon:yes gene_type:complete
VTLAQARDFIKAEAIRRESSVRCILEEMFEGGVWLPNGEPVSDLSLVYRIPEVDDLGRGARGSGGEKRGRHRVGRSESKGRREREHA